MPPTLLAFHGFTQNGALLRRHLAPLMDRIAGTELVCPDGPHACEAASLERLFAQMPGAKGPPPHRCWWDASSDGTSYRGWESTRMFMAQLLTKYPDAGLLGFSQGAMLAATVAGMATAGEVPSPRYVVLVAGAIPRAEALRKYFDTPIAVPSLHVWGTRDPLAAASKTLVERFAESRREAFVWEGPHVVPTRGAAAEAIGAFIQRARQRDELE